jgi:putative membrane protein
MKMKKVTTTAKRLSYVLFIGLGTLVAASCSNNKPEDSADVAEEQNEEMMDDRKSEKDAEFLVEAAGINLEEIKLGELAQERGTLADVKDLGKMMVKEHKQAQSDLQKLADSKSVIIPVTLTEDGQDAYDKLSGKTGKDFDKEYCDMMVNGHEKAIDKFEKAASDANDADIRNWASSMLPGLQSHWDHAKMCQEKCKAMK